MSIVLHYDKKRVSYAYAANDDVSITLLPFDERVVNYVYQNGTTDRIQHMFFIGDYQDDMPMFHHFSEVDEVTAEAVLKAIGDTDVTIVVITEEKINHFSRLNHFGSVIGNVMTFNFGSVDTSKESYYSGHSSEYEFNWLLIKSTLPVN